MKFLRILLFVVLVSCSGRGSGNVETDPDYREAIERLEVFIRHEMSDKGLPALSIALVDDQRTVWATGFGMANPDDRIVAAAHAGVAYRNYYEPDLSVVTDVEERGIEESSGRRIWVLTTLEREMATSAPVLLNHIHAEYERVRYLPGSVGDGAIRIYVRNADP